MEFEYYHYVKDETSPNGLRAVSSGTTLSMYDTAQFDAEFERIEQIPLVLKPGLLAYAIATDQAGDRYHVALRS